ncbi:hypothetical protein [Streptomyces radicis]|uniref:Gliding motility protein n=1 Tax=Streptomyces radicis TaxID=1750517 RepID=A0A3A9W0R3_9ACTN|nr:hypothetical protein [Streptomyces radicis]RKN06815.1 hypothetical protein D7319_20645 [Streptomyces radicis]RKN19433.1 hypothetical protein D7318_20110 [Streptomyces radicis]
MGVFAWFRGRGKGTSEPAACCAGAAAAAATEEKAAAAQPSGTAEGGEGEGADEVGIPKQTAAPEAADSGAGEGAARS